MNHIDYSLLRGRIILFTCVLVVCILMLWFSFSQLSKQQQMMGSTQTDMGYVEEKIDRLNNLASLFEQFNSDYRKYEAKGFLNEEHRLIWIETLEKTANRLGLRDLRYRISPRQESTNQNLIQSPNLTLFESKLTLESELAHEGDLVNLVADLAQLNSGLFVVDSCKITRVDLTATLAFSNNFQAVCDMHCYTASYHEQASEFEENDFTEGEL
ncbi:MAG: hypothetical protein QNK31_02805 [Porticoccus sp.]|nr:hypothetical protein [Porticoccus sp.]